MKTSAEAAVKEINAAGGVNGKKIEIVYEDDQFKPDVGLKVTTEMVQRDKVNFVVGFIFSNVLLAAAKPVLDSETFLITTTAGPLPSR